MRECPLGPLMLAVHKLCVIGQALIVKDVLVQLISIVSYVKRTEECLLSAKTETMQVFLNITKAHSCSIKVNTNK